MNASNAEKMGLATQCPPDPYAKSIAGTVDWADEMFGYRVGGPNEGDVLRHEPMGIVVEAGSSVRKLKKGDRVVVPFVIACGHCFFCTKQLYSCCDTTNPDAEKASKLMGHAPAGLFGYSHLLGGYPGGQAEYLRVPHADVGPIKIESGLSDEKVLFLSDIFPTGYMAARHFQYQWPVFYQLKTLKVLKAEFEPGQGRRA
jgi:threonine dehydrogenase-like Zn-dependent dehydrogenase